MPLSNLTSLASVIPSVIWEKKKKKSLTLPIAAPTEHGEDEILQHVEWLRHLLWRERDPTPHPASLPRGSLSEPQLPHQNKPYNCSEVRLR